MAGKKSRAGARGLRLRPAPKGRDVDPRVHAEILDLLGDAPRRRDLLIEHLHRIQDHYGHLSAAHVTALAYEMRLTPVEVYEVASFYHHFDIVKEGESPPPPLTIRVCDSVACAMAGGDVLLEELQARLGPGIRVIPAPCIGQCDRAPAVVVGRHVIGHASVSDVEERVLSNRTDAETPPYTGYHEYRAAGGYETLRRCMDGVHAVDPVMASVEASGLRGLGGAGFPTHRKWRLVRAEPGPRTVVLNADEGEPGTFKDRFCLESDPHRVLEGLLIAAWVVEADDVYIYLRDEYAGARQILKSEIAALLADPPCPLPRIHLRRGAGAYICGEETSLLESLEGKRGEPRLRPPFPAQKGLFGRPTLIHNVETAYWLRTIIENGADAFASRGINGRTGARLFSVSGRVAQPGVYLAPNGTTVKQLIDTYAGGMLPGHTFYAYLPGGASGGILPAEFGDVPLDFDVLARYGCFIGSAAVVVLSDRDSAMAAARNVMRFFAHESCGKCTPCRTGTAKSVELLRDRRWNLPLLDDLGRAMADASICGLGQAAPNPVRCVVKFFPKELNA